MIPKQVEKHGLTPKQITFSKHSIWKIARNYTKEAGVRQLEREIGNVCRKAAKEIFTTERKKIAVTDRNIHRFLGKEKYTYQMANIAAEVWNCPGTCMDKRRRRYASDRSQCNAGKGELMLTGQLGDVMKESARTGISYIRSVSKNMPFLPDFFEKHDIHVHIPEGAVPKDGPSAGITMAVAMLSAITEKKVRADLAMTGEVNADGACCYRRFERKASGCKERRDKNGARSESKSGGCRRTFGGDYKRNGNSVCREHG